MESNESKGQFIPMADAKQQSFLFYCFSAKYFETINKLWKPINIVLLKLKFSSLVTKIFVEDSGGMILHGIDLGFWTSIRMITDFCLVFFSIAKILGEIFVFFGRNILKTCL